MALPLNHASELAEILKAQWLADKARAAQARRLAK